MSRAHRGRVNLQCKNLQLAGATVRRARTVVCTPLTASRRRQHWFTVHSPVVALLHFSASTLLWPPYGIGQAIIFLPCGLVLSIFLFFLAQSQRSEIGCLPYFHTWCGLSANLECRSEMCCTWLAENQDAKMTQKIAIWAPSHNFVGLYLRT